MKQCFHTKFKRYLSKFSACQVLVFFVFKAKCNSFEISIAANLIWFILFWNFFNMAMVRNTTVNTKLCFLTFCNLFWKTINPLVVILISLSALYTRFKAKFKISLQKSKIRKKSQNSNMVMNKYSFTLIDVLPCFIYMKINEELKVYFHPVEFVKHQSQIPPSLHMEIDSIFLSPNTLAVEGRSLIFLF